ncbi:hypothetical protein [Rhizobium laguerreae]|uniref:hypothetical protein n=1 Tax=Rhizobium laguerreae TaxID=1076926 RepID=UPI001C8FBC82|nr:hypothetical protein [Rhizobium laguerreae]MBY3486120.1 hypothetical protein [Rhizobium laguerreae]
MDYYDAELQKHRLDEGITRRGGFQLPLCDDARPCVDGRCPSCCACLDSYVREFLGGPEALARPWTRLAVAFDPTGSGEEGASPFDLGKIKGNMVHLSLSLQTPNSALIGTFGILSGRAGTGGGTRLAIEICATGCKDGLEKFVGDHLESQYKCNIQPLPLFLQGATSHRPILAEGLLCGYMERNLTAPDAAKPIGDEKLLVDLAQSYGQHIHADRLVTHGLVSGRGGITFAPGILPPLFRTSRHDQWAKMMGRSENV